MTHTAHTGANRLTHPYKHMLTSPVMCSQKLCVIHWMNNLLTSKFTEFHIVFAYQKLLTCKVTYLLIRSNKVKFFPWNVNNADRNDVNKQNTHKHTSHREKDNTGKG